MNPKELPLVVLKKRGRLAHFWEHYVGPEAEIASSLLVMVVDTFGWIHIPHQHSLVVHQVSSTGCLAFMTAHLVRRYREYKEKYHVAPIDHTKETLDSNSSDFHCVSGGQAVRRSDVRIGP